MPLTYKAAIAACLVLAAAAVWLTPPLYQPSYAPVGRLGVSFSQQDKVNINTAPAEELRTLDGIGEKSAAAIVAYRRQNPPFQTAEDLLAVKGIGPKTLDKIRDYICFS